MEWYYGRGGEEVGPVMEAEFRSLVAAGYITDKTMVWHPGMNAWTRYGEVKRGGAFFDSPDASAVEWHYYCVECGNAFPVRDMVIYDKSRVCYRCKPLFYQRLFEGSKLPGVFDFANLWSRAGAKIIDWFIIGMVIVFAYVLFFAMVGAMAGPPGKEPSPAFAAMIMLFMVGIMALAFVGPVFYNALFLARWGATPGKMAFNIKVVRSDGTRLNFLRALGRSGAELLSQAVMYIGYFTAPFDDEKRALHDMVADTRVIND